MVHLPVPSGVVAAANPTAPSPLSQITSGPSTEHFELRLRQNAAATCGYISGNIASPITCGSNFSCKKGVLSEFGCCNELECDTNYANACVDRSNPDCVVAGVAMECQYLPISILTCPDACITYLLKAPSAFSTATYASYSCGKTGATRIAIAKATNGAGGGGGDDSGDVGGGGVGGGGIDIPTIPGLVGGGTPETTSITGGGNSNNNNDNNGGNTGDSGNTGGGNNNNPSFNSASESSGGLGAGAIAGIAVGSAAGALLVAVLVWFFFFRPKSNKPPPSTYTGTTILKWTRDVDNAQGMDSVSQR